MEDRFIGLNPEDQQRLRLLNEQLQADPDAPQLRAIMHRYGEWLKTLSSYRRAELAEMKPAERVDWIQKEEQRREGSRRPGGKDMDVLLKWMNEYVGRNEKRFLESLTERERGWLTEFNAPTRRHGNEFMMMWQHRQSSGSRNAATWMTDDDLSRLRALLSPETRKRLETLPPAKQWELLANWIRQGQGMRHPGRGIHGPLPKANDERLAEFFEKDLTDDERDQLLGLPSEEMQRRLQQMYLMHTRPLEGPERRPGGPNHGRRPGGGRPRQAAPTASRRLRNRSRRHRLFVGVAVALPPLGAAVQLPHQRTMRSRYCQCPPDCQLWWSNLVEDVPLCNRWQEFHRRGNLSMVE